MHGGGLALAMLAVFGSARLLAELCERLRQPGIVGEILAGILIGPALLGWVTPDPVLDAFADLGVMFLLFRVGLEVRSEEHTSELQSPYVISYAVFSFKK